MSKRSDLKERIHTLGEIKGILNAMKNLSIIEMNKVSRFLGAQNELASTIEEALGDYERFFGREAKYDERGMLYVLLGSERGFCGGFNEAILKKFNEIASEEKTGVKVIAIGRKLASKIEAGGRIEGLEVIEGPSAAEEIAGSITELVRCLTRFPKMRWTVVHHENGDLHDHVVVVCPFFPKPAVDAARRERFAPLLNLSPKELYPQIFEQYLFSVLYRAFYLSFLSENRERLQHMDGALRSLEENWNLMRKKSNELRQEEITEELEIIMLSAGL